MYILYYVICVYNAEKRKFQGLFLNLKNNRFRWIGLVAEIVQFVSCCFLGNFDTSEVVNAKAKKKIPQNHKSYTYTHIILLL